MKFHLFPDTPYEKCVPKENGKSLTLQDEPGETWFGNGSRCGHGFQNLKNSGMERTDNTMSAQLHKHFAALAHRVAVDRDKTAFTELFDYFAPRIKNYLRKLNLEESAAEDLAQEVMIVLWHKAHLFDSKKSSLGTWLFRVARNRRIDVVRRDKSGLLNPDEPMLQPSAEEPADEQMDAEQRDERIRLAMAKLPEEQIELVRLAFFLGLSHSQISDKTGLPLGTVKSRIRLAFGRLRRALEGDTLIDTDF